MEVSINTRQAYSEIDEFLELLTNNQINKIPLKLRRFFKEEKDPNYKKGIDPKVPIKNQNLKEETLAIIALLNLQYWCEDKKEKERLQKVYTNNEKVYQEVLQIKFNPDEILKKRNKRTNIEETVKNEVALVEYGKPLFKKIVDIIKSVFHIK